MKVSVESRVGVIQEELKTIFDEKEVIAKNIDNKIIIFYEKIRKWAKDSSIVPIKKQACSGCFIRINDRIFVDLFKADAITTCPHCGRILYLDKAEMEAIKEAQKNEKATKEVAPKSAKSTTKKATSKSATSKSAKSATKATSAKTKSTKSTTKSTKK